MSKRKKNTDKFEVGSETETVISESADNFPKAEMNEPTFFESLKQTLEGLLYLSETDAELQPFVGNKADAVNLNNLLLQTGAGADRKAEEKDFDEFFQPLIKFESWFGEEERKMAEKFVRLKELLQANLKDLKVFRIGKKEIDIYVVGLDEEYILCGIQTKAVET